MAEVVVTEAAEADYLEGLLWYASRSLQAAIGFEAEFERSLQIIGAQPGTFAACDPMHRRFIMRRYPYQIVYRADGEQVLIIAVAHAKRRPTFWKNRD